jgi:hypothetical protein
MGKITVKVTGADPDKDQAISYSESTSSTSKTFGLNNDGGGKFSAEIDCSPGTYIYAIVLYGDPGAPWTAAVTTGVITHPHSGHFSPAGYGSTGDTAITVGKR